MIARTPEPPYFAVIFSSILKADHKGYTEMAKKMEELAQVQPGYLGFESARARIGISISYWKDLESIKKWKTMQIICSLKNLESKSGTLPIK